MEAQLAIWSGWEMTGVLVIVLVLFYPFRIARWLGAGLAALWGAREKIDQDARAAGLSLGGIFGKPAAEALTMKNETAELYDPAVFRKEPSPTESNPPPVRRDWHHRLWEFVTKLWSHGVGRIESGKIP